MRPVIAFHVLHPFFSALILALYIFTSALSVSDLLASLNWTPLYYLLDVSSSTFSYFGDFIFLWTNSFFFFLLLFLLLLMRFSSHDFYCSCFLYREAVVKWAEVNVALSWPFWSCYFSSGCGTGLISLGLHNQKVANTAFFTTLLSQYHHGCPSWWW